MELVLVLHNIRSTYNVGAIMRTAEGMGVSSVVLSGYTPKIHDSNLLPHLREKLDKEIHKTALGAEDMVRTEIADDLKALLLRYKEQGFRIVGLENHISKKTFSISGADLKKMIGEKCLLILGEEVGGISQDLYDFIELFVEIPMAGKKESFNVSVAAGIAMYELTKTAKRL